MRWLKSYSELAHLRTQLKSPAHAKSNTTCALGSRITCALKSGITCALKTRIACALNGQWSGGASYVNIWGIRWKIIIHQHMPGRVGTHHTIYAGSDGRSSYINLWGVGWGHIIYQPAGGGVKDHHTSTYGGVLGDHHTSTFAGRGEDTSYIKDWISFLMLQLWHWAKPRTPLPLISEFQRMFPLWNLRMFMQGFFPARLLQSGCFFMLY